MYCTSTAHYQLQTHGAVPNIAQPRNCAVSPGVQLTIQGLVRDWNQNIDKMATSVKEANDQLLENMNAGKLDTEAVVRAWLPVPAALPLPSSAWASWFLKEWGWSFLSRSSDTQTWLPWDHADMQASRDRLRTLIHERHVHPALGLNFDQLWRSCYQFGGTLLGATLDKERTVAKRPRRLTRSCTQ